MWEFANRTFQFGWTYYFETPSLFYPHFKYITLGVPSPVDISAGAGLKAWIIDQITMNQSFPIVSTTDEPHCCTNRASLLIFSATRTEHTSESHYTQLKDLWASNPNAALYIHCHGKWLRHSTSFIWPGIGIDPEVSNSFP